MDSEDNTAKEIQSYIEFIIIGLSSIADDKAKKKRVMPSLMLIRQVKLYI